MKVDMTDVYQKSNADIAHLWQPNDQAWFERRKKHAYGFKKLLDQDTKSFQKVLEAYFFTGVQREYIGDIIKFMMTPIACPQQALEVFNSGCWDKPSKQKIYRRFIFYFSGNHRKAAEQLDQHKQ